MSSSQRNTLFYGDNLSVLREHVASESVDLIYLDPPFNSNADYNVLFAERGGEQSHAQVTAFKDTWQWDTEAAANFNEALHSGAGKVPHAMAGLKSLLGTSDMMAYLSMMAPRLVELRRVLKPVGSLYLHCDPTASHYLKILLDAVFGAVNFRNEIIWQRTNAHNMKTRRYGRIHDVVFYTTKTDSYVWNQGYGEFSQAQLDRYEEDEEGRLFTGQDLTMTSAAKTRNFEWRGTRPPPNRGWGASLEQLEAWWSAGLILTKRNGAPRLDGRKVYLDEKLGKPIGSIWDDVPRIGNTSDERLGYPTQKPDALLERIIAASSNEGDVVLDPFCGCGTAVVAAQKLDRRWLGIDITHLATNLIKTRLRDSFNLHAGKDYAVVGEPTDLAGAQQLFNDNPYQFQYWALSLVECYPQDQTKGADKGVDGRLWVEDAGEVRPVPISVKGGKNLSVPMLRDLRGVVERENAVAGVLISLAEPTGPMRAEAADAGFHQFKTIGNARVPRLQLLTIAELLAGKGIALPPQSAVRASKQAPRARRADRSQLDLIK